MATPFAAPRTGQLYFRRAVPEALRSAFDGKAQIKVTLGTKDPVEAKAAFARENALYEQRLVDARQRMAEGTLLPTPAALVRRWCEGPAVNGGITGPQRMILTFMELDAAVGSRHTASASDIYPPAILGPAANTNWAAALADKARFETVISEGYGGDVEQTGTNWIRARWHTPEGQWMPCIAGPVARLRVFDDSAARFTDDVLAKALLAVVDEKRTGDEDVNRARLARHRPRTQQPRLRPHMRLKQLYAEWKAGNNPRPPKIINCSRPMRTHRRRLEQGASDRGHAPSERAAYLRSRRQAGTAEGRSGARSGWRDDPAAADSLLWLPNRDVCSDLLVAPYWRAEQKDDCHLYGDVVANSRAIFPNAARISRPIAVSRRRATLLSA